MASTRFDAQMDPELAPAYEIYRMVGLDDTDFPPNNITSVFRGAEGFAPEADHSQRFMRDQYAALSRALHSE